MATKAGKKTRRMTQSEVVKHFSETTGMSRADAKRLFDELNKLAAHQVKTTGEFLLPGFGKLVKAERKARQGRNPMTGETIQIPAKTALKFRISKTLKDATLPRGATESTASFDEAEPPADFDEADSLADFDEADSLAELAGESTKGNKP